MTRIERCSERLQERYTLVKHESGLDIYVFPKPLTTTYAVFATRFGSVDNRYRKAGEAQWTEFPDGTAHFLEHKLFENSNGVDSTEVFSSYGADANAYTAYQRTAYLFSCTEQAENSLRELLRFVREPYFTEQTVQKEIGIIAEEIRMYQDNPWERCFQSLLCGLYREHPIRRNICGSEESISRITPEILYDCHKAFYRLSNMALIVCGDVTVEQILSIANEILPTEREEFSIERERIVDMGPVHQPYAETKMQVSKPIFSIGIKDRRIPEDPRERMRRDAAMTLLGTVLFSRSAAFYSDLFEEGVITASYSYGYSITDGVGFHAISGESDSPKEVARRLWEYLHRVRERGIDPEEFERVRRVLYADELRGYDSTEDIANNLLTQVFDDAELFDYLTVLEELSLEELTELLDTMLDPAAYCLSVVLPQAPSEGN